MSPNGLVIPTSFDPSATDNPEIFFHEAFSILMKKLEITTPGVIEAYDRITHLARIRPMVMIRYANNTQVPAEPLTVEIYRMSAGGFVIDFPIKVGDTGWFISSDRDVSKIKETKALGLPSSVEVHSFKRGFWIPDMWGELELGENTENCLTIQSIDGKQKVSLGLDAEGKSRIFIFSDEKVDVSAKNVVVNAIEKAEVHTKESIVEATEKVNVSTKEANVTATTSATITTPESKIESTKVEIIGKTSVSITGDTTITGNLSVTKDTSVGGKASITGSATIEGGASISSGLKMISGNITTSEAIVLDTHNHNYGTLKGPVISGVASMNQGNTGKAKNSQ